MPEPSSNPLSYKTFVHFEALLQRVRDTPEHPIFKLPDPAAPGLKWLNVSYKQFEQDLTRLAKYWHDKLSRAGVEPRSVVGVWLRGFTYADVLTIFALSRASYIPQLFGFELPNTRIVYTLLSTYSGRAIIHDPAKTPLLTTAPASFTLLPCFCAPHYQTVTDEMVKDLPTPAYPRLRTDEDWTFIYHTSGSVSGMPKVVPNTNGWLGTIKGKSPEAFAIGWGEEDRGRDVYLWTESFSHSMEICLFLLILHNTASLVQPTRIDFSSHELANMIQHAGVNRIVQFTNVLKMHLLDARRDSVPGLVPLLRSAKQVTYAGMPLPSELEDWAVKEAGIRITNNFGCTECGQLFTSTVGDGRLKLLPTVKAAFMPIEMGSAGVGAGVEPGAAVSPLISSNPTEDADADAPSASTPPPPPQLYELLILSTSPDLPISTLCTALPDAVGGGKGWRSGDLFEKVGEDAEGAERYIFRGRDDDWVKSLWSEKLDTRSIEDLVYRRCPDLVANCVVVGNGRPQPALFVEVHDKVVLPSVGTATATANSQPESKTARGVIPSGWNTEEAKRRIEEIKSDIVERIREDMELRYLHERIEDSRMVMIVPVKTLPRTAVKGNIRRRAIEEQFSDELEAMYASMPIQEVYATVLDTAVAGVGETEVSTPASASASVSSGGDSFSEESSSEEEAANGRSSNIGVGVDKEREQERVTSTSANGVVAVAAAA